MSGLQLLWDNTFRNSGSRPSQLQKATYLSQRNGLLTIRIRGSIQSMNYESSIALDPFLLTQELLRHQLEMLGLRFLESTAAIDRPPPMLVEHVPEDYLHPIPIYSRSQKDPAKEKLFELFISQNQVHSGEASITALKNQGYKFTTPSSEDGVFRWKAQKKQNNPSQTE